ncbi:YwdI family protein [Bacillus sp. T33-2]|uniref:YwdI family protein n=1 Tax=Bacillus sp. T33-2 TaxID=2054168 RepID=UPI000C764375|nr:YwdI family protein [Bacillus sp. T33-2]PLR96577.1 hypothetical protein CVD19_11340 [Bacillus sp. T33-2]
MNISVHKLLAKMEEELRGAKAAPSDADLREKIHSLKTLCEIILEEPQKMAENPGSTKDYLQQPAEQPVRLQAFPQPPQILPSTLTQPKPLKVEGDANGDSIFDF